MPGINNTGAVRAWLRRCPALEQGRLFGVDYLAEGESYSLDAMPSELKYRENILGELELLERQEQGFVFSVRAPYGEQFQQNLDNLGAMQAVSAWIIEQNSARSFPDWEGGEVTGIVPSLSACPTSMGSAYARYQIQIKVAYRVTE